jgi:hypothetical protein
MGAQISASLCLTAGVFWLGLWLMVNFANAKELFPGAYNGRDG